MSLKNKQAVIWITGHSSAGKTSVARKLQNFFVEDNLNCIFLDGDDLRSILSQKWGYTKEERLSLAKCYIQLASHLSSQGNIVIISAIAMFEEIFDWFKTNVDNSQLIFLDVPLDVRLERDEKSKRVYREIKDQKLDYQIPTSPDLRIKNYGDTTLECAAKLIFNQWSKDGADNLADRGKATHWEEFYKSSSIPFFPSPFASWCLEQWSANQSVIDIGCGNGRDSYFFANAGHNVTGIDVSNEAISACKANSPKENLNFVCASLDTHLKNNPALKADIVYSRFSLHAMTDLEEEKTIKAASNLLNPGGEFFIETRSIDDTLAKKGELISHFERVEGHYRRFADADALTKRLEQYGFKINYIVEKNGLAVFKEEDPVVIRIQAQKI